ncbi:MAG: universal stress protein [Kofleriaceae bacterium]|nr:universal stress protein [Kofleriaceae bacterium]MCL4228358.1 universal stress protein [Myxococcales bacterium]
MALRKIVVGMDLTPGSEVAARRAGEIAARHGAEVVLVFAATVPEQPEVPASMAPTAAALVKVLDDRLSANRDELGAMRERVAAATGATVSQLIVDEFADDALVAAATEVGADLIVTGSRGRTGLRRWLLGSVAEHVVRQADISVLVARAGDPDHGFARIVVGTDFSPGATIALARAVELAEPGAVIDLVHCYHMPLLRPLPGVDPVLAEDFHNLSTELVADAHARGEAAVAVHAGAPVTFRIHVVDEHPREAVCDLAEKVGADLVAVGSHGRRGLRRLILGSVAEATVRHAPCSVLVAR